MRHTIEFGVETGELGTNLSISGPSTPLRLSTKRRESAQPAFDHKVFRFDKVKAGTRANQNIGELTLLAEKLAGVYGKDRKAVMRAALDYLYFVGSGQAKHLEADPDIKIHEPMATSTTDAPAVTMKAPDMSDPVALEDVAVRAMTGMAKNLRYTGMSLSEVLSVSADKDSGLAIISGCHPYDSLTTLDDYNPDSGFVQLYCEALDQPQPAQQLTALVGAVSIAHR